MAEKTLSIEELVALAQSGAKITTEKRPTIFATIKQPDAKPTEIAKFGELVEKLDALAKSNEALAKADHLRSQTMLEVLATLQALIKTSNVTKSQPAIDMSPLKSVLSDIKHNTVPVQRASYEFTVNRDKAGFIDKITAKPSNSLH